ncbi:MAG: hypothetical protein H0V94_02300, partial [Actinobacteria bacterium]|nr:hypothetical protein [Actinomycetota bacterium]
ACTVRSSSAATTPSLRRIGPYTFDNVVSGRQHVQATEVLATDGSLLQFVINIQFSETDTNSETGAKLMLKGAAHEVWDFASNANR